MNFLFTVDTDPTAEVKGLELVKTRHLKTKTVLEVQVGKVHPPYLTPYLDDYELSQAFARDIKTLGLEGAGYGPINIMVEGARSFGRVSNRAAYGLSKLGIISGPSIPWGASAGEQSYTVKWAHAAELPEVFWLLLRIARRSCRVIGHTQHPLTLYDFRQAIGLVYDVAGGWKGATDIDDWVNLRELMVLEEVKGVKAKVKGEEGNGASLVGRK